MQKYELLLDSDQADNILVQNLFDMKTTMLSDLKARIAGTNLTNGIFDTDRDIDIDVLKKHIDAINIVLKYYTTPTQQETLLTTYAPDTNINLQLADLKKSATIAWDELDKSHAARAKLHDELVIAEAERDALLKVYEAAEDCIGAQGTPYESDQYLMLCGVVGAYNLELNKKYWKYRNA